MSHARVSIVRELSVVVVPDSQPLQMEMYGSNLTARSVVITNLTIGSKS